MKEVNPFKEKLYNHTLPVGDDLWNRIESQLPQAVDQKKFPFFLVAIPFIILLSAALILLSLQEKKSHPEKTAPEPKTMPTTPSTNPEALDDVSLSESQTINNQSLPNAPVSVAYHENNLDAQSTNNHLSVSNSNSNSSHHKTSGKSIGSDNQVKISSAGKDIETGHNNKYQSELFPRGNIESRYTINTSLSATQIAGENASGKRDINPFLHIPWLDILPVNEQVSNTKEESAKLNAALNKIKPDPSCYKFSGQEGKSNLSVDVFAGPGFSPRSFENTTNESELYAEAREETETSRYAWSGGARVNLKLNHEWAVRVGITYDQAGDVFDYTDTLATKQSTIIDTFFAADGSFLYAETRTILIFGTLIKQIHNRYHHIDVPLLMSYELPMGRASLMLNMGPVLNLTTSVRGQILDPSLTPRHISEREPNHLKAYKNNLGLSFYLGAGALIPLNENFSALIEPRFLYRIKPVTIENYPLKEHRHFAGVNLGIRYHFD